MSRSSRQLIEKRQRYLAELLRQDPLRTDEALARELGVSVPTVRLDRLRLGIPEVRVRARQLAEQMTAGRPRALLDQEVIGELLELQLGRLALSLLRTTDAMAFARTGIIRGHYLFAQANSLAVAVIDAEVALTGSARLRFVRPVRVGEDVVARATVLRRRQRSHLVEVESRAAGEPVLRGLLVVAVPEPAETS